METDIYGEVLGMIHMNIVSLSLLPLHMQHSLMHHYHLVVRNPMQTYAT